jgi:hypothetical protein
MKWLQNIVKQAVLSALAEHEPQKPIMVTAQRVPLVEGDCILLKVDRPITREMADRIRDTFRGRFPGFEAMVLDSHIEFSVISRGHNAGGLAVN